MSSPADMLSFLPLLTCRSVLSEGPSRTVTAKKEVILTAGAVGSAKILLDSGIGPKEELEKIGVKSVVDIHDVGKGLTDHLTTSIMWSANGTDTPCVQSTTLPFSCECMLIL